MTEAEQDRFLAVWLTLPDSVRNQPASEQELTVFEAQYGPIPQDYRWFLSVCGGGPVDLTKRFFVMPLDRLDTAGEEFVLPQEFGTVGVMFLLGALQAMVVIELDADAAVAPVAQVNDFVGVEPPYAPVAAALVVRRLADAAHKALVELVIELDPAC